MSESQVPPSQTEVAVDQAIDGDSLPYAMGWPLLIGALAGVALRLAFSGKPGDPFATMAGAFIFLAPVLVGVVTVYVAETQKRRGWGYYSWAGFFANVLFVAGTLIILIEGLIFAILIVPLFALIGGISGMVLGLICRTTRWPRHTVYGFALLPLLLGGFDPSVPLPDRIESIERARIVAASPEQVWEQLNHTRDIEPREVQAAWMYRIGVPLPISGVTQLGPEGPVRRIAMGKGIHFDQLAAEWEPPHRVRWVYHFTPDSFPPHALDDHVKIGGHYFDLRDTEYTLTPVGDTPSYASG